MSNKPTYSIKPIQLYRPAGKKEIRLVYRAFSLEDRGLSTRHQKSFSIGKLTEKGAWKCAQEAFDYCQRTGQLPKGIELPVTALRRPEKKGQRVSESTVTPPPRNHHHVQPIPDHPCVQIDQSPFHQLVTKQVAGNVLQSLQRTRSLLKSNMSLFTADYANGLTKPIDVSSTLESLLRNRAPRLDLDHSRYMGNRNISPTQSLDLYATISGHPNHLGDIDATDEEAAASTYCLLKGLQTHNETAKCLREQLSNFLNDSFNRGREFTPRLRTLMY